MKLAVAALMCASMLGNVPHVTAHLSALDDELLQQKIETIVDAKVEAVVEKLSLQHQQELAAQRAMYERRLLESSAPQQRRALSDLDEYSGLTIARDAAKISFSFVRVGS